MLICLELCLYSENTPVFSDEEKENLEYIFDSLFKFDHFTYTLFSDKPISFETICTSNTTHVSATNYSIILSYQRPINLLENSWRTWQSKCANLEFNNYIFFQKKKLELEHITIILINKIAFSKTFNANKKIFQDVLGKDLTEEKLLQRIMADDLSLHEALNNHQGLVGILLGFGNINSMLYEKRNNISQSTIIDPEITESKLAKINNNFGTIKKFYCCLHVINPIRFVYQIEHPETQMLLKKYDKVKSDMSKIYKDRNFVDVIIQNSMKVRRFNKKMVQSDVAAFS